MNFESPWWIFLFVIAQLLGGLLFMQVILYVIASLGGWRQVSQVHPASAAPLPPPHETKVFRFQSGMFGWAGYNNCLTLRVAPGGLYLSVMWIFRAAHPTLFIPWQAMRDIQTKKFWWSETVKFTVGDPKMATITLPRKIFLAAKELPQSSLAAENATLAEASP